MTSEEAVSIAKAACEAQGWRWRDPVYVRAETTRDGRTCWWVTSDDPEDWTTQTVAPDLAVQIDNNTGEVLSIGSNIR